MSSFGPAAGWIGVAGILRQRIIEGGLQKVDITSGWRPSNTSRLRRLRNRLLALLFEQLLFRDVTAYRNHIRERLGLPPQPGSVLDDMSPFLYLQGSTPAFEYPRSDLPSQVHFIGPLLPEPPERFVAPI